MRSKKFNDEAVAKEAIATSPDVTPGEESASRTAAPTASKSRKAVEEPVEVSPDEIEREASRGRVFAGGIRRVYKHTMNDDFTEDQVEAASELGQLLFGSLREAQAPRWLHGTILGAVLILPFVPALYKLFKAETKPLGEGVK